MLLNTKLDHRFPLWLVILALSAAFAQTSLAEQTTQPAPNAERFEELIGDLRSNNYDHRQAAIKELVAAGESAVPVLLHFILDEPRGQGTFDAECALRLMGPKARPALPRLIQLAQARPASQPAGSQPGTSPRLIAMVLLEGMSWAAKELIPVMLKIAEDPQEENRTRTMAISILGKMGKDAIPILRRYAAELEARLAETAHAALANLLQEQGIQTRAEYFTALIETDLFNPKVPEYLNHTKTRINEGRTHPLTEKVKAAYRARLKDKSDPELALSLARVIQRQLAGTALQWAAPANSGGAYWLREDPTESYITLAEVLSIGFAQAEKSSDLQQTIGVGLAKLRLLQGDWKGMNDVLTQMGWSPIPPEHRPFLAAPPMSWAEDLSKQWTLSDEQMRSGDCGFVLRVEKDGKGVPGAHVLVKKWKQPDNVFRSGIAVDTLFYQPQPLPVFGNYSFGYGGSDRAMTRYAVSDETGQVQFDKLPETEIQIELLVPTANFAEASNGWDLWMEVAPSEMKRAVIYGDKNVVNRNEPPAVVKLKPGQIVRYPRLVVLPQLNLDIDDWSKVDPKTFEISWSQLPGESGEQIVYELEMILTAPTRSHGTEHIAAIESTKETLRTNRWTVGAKGVGGMKLRPGNIYAFGVSARDQDGKVLSQSPKKRVWVPWDLRPCDAPVTDPDTYRQSPIEVDTWFRGSFGYGDGRSENLEEKVARHLREYPNAFEREYVELGKAWLDWHAGKKTDAETQLKKLIEGLPEDNVPRATAASLMQQIKAGESPPKRLKLIGFSTTRPE